MTENGLRGMDLQKKKIRIQYIISNLDNMETTHRDDRLVSFLAQLTSKPTSRVLGIEAPYHIIVTLSKGSNEMDTR